MTRNKRDAMTLDLFDSIGEAEPAPQTLCPGAVILPAYAGQDDRLLAALQDVIAAAPFRRMVTPGGFSMSVAMSNCGSFGWVTDSTGYRYDSIDPMTGRVWPRMPDCFSSFARDAAAEAGFDGYTPDACLINRYEPGARLSLHQDKDERDFSWPIVSVSFGIPAVFLFGGLSRADKPMRVPLLHGDVVVWGGAARLRYHGVMSVREAYHERLGRCRINLTFRKVT